MFQISVDLLLISRVLAAFSWGIAWAAYLQFNRYGQFLVEQRTWLTVVIGIGVDLLIAYPYANSQSDWYTVTLVIAVSSLGIIARSLHNEHKEVGLNVRSYKLIWGLEDAVALCSKTTLELVKLLETGELRPEQVKAISRIVGMVYNLTEVLRTARRGDYNQKRIVK